MLTVTPTAAHCTVDDDCSDSSIDTIYYGCVVYSIYDSSQYDETVKIARCNKTFGLCECILPMCFDYNSDANQCELKRCHKTVLSNDGKAIGCINQGAKSKTTALYLNIISFTGATNFYLGNYMLAAGQLLLFKRLIVTCCLRLCSCCILCCVFVGKRIPERFMISAAVAAVIKLRVEEELDQQFLPQKHFSYSYH